MLGKVIMGLAVGLMVLVLLALALGATLGVVMQMIFLGGTLLAFLLFVALVISLFDRVESPPDSK